MHRARYYKTSKDFHYNNYPNVLTNVHHVYPHIYVTESHEKSTDDPVQTEQPPVKMNMKWTTVQQSNSKHPDVWGPAFWFTLHNGASVYPVEASSICAERMKGFIIGMPPPEIMGGVLRESGSKAIVVSLDKRSGGARYSLFLITFFSILFIYLYIF